MRQLKIANTRKNEEGKPKKLTKKQVQELNLIGHIGQIVEQARDSKLSDTFYKQVKPHTDYVGKALDLTATQTVLISLGINQNYGSSFDLDDLSNVLDCENIKLIGLMNEMDVLVEKRYICSRICGNDYQFNVPIKFIDAVRKEETYIPVRYANLNKHTLFISIEKVLKVRKHGECSYEFLLNDLICIVESNQHLPFCKQIYKYCNNSTVSRLHSFVLLMLFCSCLVRALDNKIYKHEFYGLFDEEFQNLVQAEMVNGTQELMEEDEAMIEFTIDNGYKDRNSFRLTKKARQELLSDYDLKIEEAESPNQFMLHGSISNKRMFYNEQEGQQVERLESLLQEENFKSIQSRLADSGMRKGFACLFYGSPGTGKTETVYQLARQTGRDIMEVNIAELKSCWVGESEKNMKELFNRYRNYCKKGSLAPILLFNEADAIIGVRMEGAERSVDKMNNTIQNIILQEMETLDGIMIATTNLTKNIDNAFDRRFLYKIEFAKPTLEAKQGIWRTMMPTLLEGEAAELARAYEFSGGQIENIVRKRTVEAIISGIEPSFETIHQFCKTEQLYKGNERKRIGF